MMKAKNAGTTMIANQREGRDLNGCQNSGSSVIWFQSMKSGNAGRRLDLGVRDARGLELEEHRHAVAAEAEEHALPEAQDAGIAPAQHEAERDEGVGQILADQVEPEDVERQRQDDDEEQRRATKPMSSDRLRTRWIVEHVLHFPCDCLSITCGP